MCSPSVSFETVKEKHGELCGLMEEQEVDQLNEVTIPDVGTYIPTEDNQELKGMGMRLYISKYAGMHTIVLEDVMDE